jgi:hypothetical protein
MFKRSYFVRSTLLLASVPVLAMACIDGGTLYTSDPAPLSPDPVSPQAEASITAEEQTAKALMERFNERLAAMPAGAVRGRVIGLDDQPIAGVTVRTGHIETVSDADGRYTLDAVPNGNHVISFEHPDYVLTQHAVGMAPGQEPWVVGRIMPRSRAHQVDLTQGGIVREGPLVLEFERSDLVLATGEDVDGVVDVVVTAIDPREPGHIDAAPARLEGVTAAGEQVGLVSFGMLEVEIFKDRKKVQVRPGQTVRTSMNVTGFAPIAAGASIPMWHHDTDLGLWVQERGTDARVEAIDGELVAVAELPHFSAWNYDQVTDAVCAHIRVTAGVPVTALRVLSTNPNGTPDASSPWSFTSNCTPDSRRGSVCTTNVPAGQFGAGVSFRFQAQQQGNSTWADLSTTLDGTAVTIMTGTQINSYLTANNMSSGSWCGIAQPTIGPGMYLTQPYQIGSFPSILPANTVRFGLPKSTTPGSSIGPSVVQGALFFPSGASTLVDEVYEEEPSEDPPASSDNGFVMMASNATLNAYKLDSDRDGVPDKTDNCPSRSNPNQADAQNNRIGDACEAWCFVSPMSPDASWYDTDADGVDDLCDPAWNTFNPSQYYPL